MPPLAELPFDAQRGRNRISLEEASLWEHIPGSFWGFFKLYDLSGSGPLSLHRASLLLTWGGYLHWLTNQMSDSSFPHIDFQANRKASWTILFSIFPNPFRVPSATTSPSEPCLCFPLSVGAFATSPSQLRRISLALSFQPEVVSSQNLHGTSLPDLHQLMFYHIPHFLFLCTLLFPSYLEFGQPCLSVSCEKKLWVLNKNFLHW